jgi:cysteine desulfurase/selenocysteine lyase
MDNLFTNIKEQFPTLSADPDLAYFDSAASTQTHSSVIDAMNHYYEHERSNVHRGDYKISRSVSEKVDTAREQVAELINASAEQVIFTSGATEGLNIVANWFKNASTVIITDMEHSANILPWIAQGRTINNGGLKVLPALTDGSIDMDAAGKLFQSCPKDTLLSIIATSNVTGHDTPWTMLAQLAKQYNISVCLDACQTVGSHKLDVSQTPIDFAVFSAHKMFGPTGVGVLYSKHDVNKLRPTRLGGGAVMHYDLEGNVEWVHGPEKHEPGTPNIAGIIGTGVAAEWIKYVGYEKIVKQIDDVSEYLLTAGLFDIPGMIPLTPQRHLRSLPSGINIHSFIFDNHHPSDVGALLGSNDVAVRAGKLCAHPFVNKLSTKGVLRISWSIYNTSNDCRKLVDQLCKTLTKLG